MLIEQFAEALFDSGGSTFTLEDLIKLATDNGISLSEARQELESYGFKQRGHITGFQTDIHGIDRGVSVHDMPIKRGDRVTILKGAVIHNLHKGTYVAGRTYKVKAHHILSGYRSHGDNGEDIHHSPKVRWPGAGGYWSEVDINDVPEAFS